MKRFRRGLAALGLMIVPVCISGCLIDQIFDVPSNVAPHAVIDAAPREGGAPLDVSFNADSSRDEDGTIVGYRWDFGDSVNPASVQSSTASHTFAQPGTYLVKLTITDDEGAVSSEQVPIVVSDAPPVALASASSSSTFSGNFVIFSSTGSYDSQGKIVSYSWDFGDGAKAVGETVVHAYSEIGSHVATLTVTDELGQIGQANLNINVLPDGGGTCSGGSCGAGNVPHAVIASDCFGSCSSGRPGEEITFSGQASDGGVGDIVGYFWDFGDGSTGSGRIVSHAYARAWAYKLTLIVVDEAGRSDTATATIRIDGTSCGD